MSLEPSSPALKSSLRLTAGAPALDVPRLARLVDFAGRAEGLSGEVGVWLCTDREIARLHHQFMGIAGPTDVMTFLSEDDQSDPPYLGDIAVSFETAADQAADAGHDVEREIAFLIVHGLLHLAGYDDHTSAARQTMLERQESLLSEFERDD